MRRARLLVLVAAMAAGLAPLDATAQVVGTFTWQTQPHCNLLTLTVIQQGGLYQLTGVDDLCGAGVAPITGTAVPSGGNVALGLTVSLPSGRAAQLSVTLNLSSLAGTWTDTDGRTGPFSVAAVSTGGTPRPEPAVAVAITSAQLSSTIFAGSGTASTIARSDHAHDDRYYTRSQIDLKLSGAASLPAGAFTARFPVTTEYEVGSGGQLFATGGTSDTFVAPVQLPDGARLASLRASVWDDSTSSLSVALYRLAHLIPSFDQMARVTSATDAPGTNMLTAGIDPLKANVDNVTYSYLVMVTCPGDWGTEGSNMRLQGIVIDYIVP